MCWKPKLLDPGCLLRAGSRARAKCAYAEVIGHSTLNRRLESGRRMGPRAPWRYHAGLLGTPLRLTEISTEASERANNECLVMCLHHVLLYNLHAQSIAAGQPAAPSGAAQPRRLRQTCAKTQSTRRERGVLSSEWKDRVGERSPR